jgi:hypothetical protein
MTSHSTFFTDAATKCASRGVFSPEDLNMMRRVFDEVCSQRNISDNSKLKRDDIARLLVDFMKVNLSEEILLTKVMSQLIHLDLSKH